MNTWNPWRQMEDRVDRARLVRETEAFLAGKTPGVVGPRDSARSWQWVNAFAHADLHTLRRIRSGRHERGERVPGHCAGLKPSNGAAAQAFDEEARRRNSQRLLANELLRLVGRDEALLRQLQRSVFIPLELDLLRESSSRSVDPMELIRVVRSALHDTSR